MKIAIIGAGAAGYFCAIRIKEELIKREINHSEIEVTLFEKGNDVLRKVRISGGGRCNVTHNQFDPKILASHYPRGQKELRGPFSRFNPQHMISWLREKGVETKIEADGRIFPLSDSSETIIKCFKKAAHDYGVRLKIKSPVSDIKLLHSGKFQLSFLRQEDNDDDESEYDFLMIATGSDRSGYFLARQLGHEITPLAPSLFTFKVNHPLLKNLEGISIPDVSVHLKLGPKKWQQRGPLLITHWGFSGPAILKLSAWAAREIKAHHYQFDFTVNFLNLNLEEIIQYLKKIKHSAPKKLITNTPPKEISKRLWKALIDHVLPKEKDRSWSELSQKSLHGLASSLFCYHFTSVGVHRFKEEFVECGGIRSKEVQFKSMESKLVKNLYFSGEILDIDGITGGFNFQNAWTSAFLSAEDIAQKISE